MAMRRYEDSERMGMAKSMRQGAIASNSIPVRLTQKYFQEDWLGKTGTCPMASLGKKTWKGKVQKEKEIHNYKLSLDSIYFSQILKLNRDHEVKENKRSIRKALLQIEKIHT